MPWASERGADVAWGSCEEPPGSVLGPNQQLWLHRQSAPFTPGLRMSAGTDRLLACSRLWPAAAQPQAVISACFREFPIFITMGEGTMAKSPLPLPGFERPQTSQEAAHFAILDPFRSDAVVTTLMQCCLSFAALTREGQRRDPHPSVTSPGWICYRMKTERKARIYSRLYLNKGQRDGIFD